MDGGNHAQVCEVLRKTLTDQRHNYFKKALESILRPLGDVQDEPHYGRGQQRADIRLDTYDASYMLDVSFVHQIASSSLKMSDPLQQRFQTKKQKYSGPAEFKFVPFVMGTFGEMHDEAFQFLRDISGAAEQSGAYHSKQAFTHVALNKLAIAAQRGNSMLMRRGAQAFRSSLYASQLAA